MNKFRVSLVLLTALSGDKEVSRGPSVASQGCQEMFCKSKKFFVWTMEAYELIWEAFLKPLCTIDLHKAAFNHATSPNLAF